MDQAQNIFSYCVGGLALISTTASVLFYCRLYLPTTRLKLLDELLAETATLYHKANEESLLPAEASRLAFTRLRNYEDQSDTLREVIYQARSCLDTLCTMFQGHGRRIVQLTGEVADLRASLMTISQREKARRTQARRQNQVAATSEVDGVYRCTKPAVTPHIDSIDGESAHPPSFSRDSAPHIPNPPTTVDHGIEGGYAPSDSAAVPSSSPRDETSRTPTCIICSVLGRLMRKSPKTAASPSPTACGEDERSPSPDTSASSMKSTLVDEPQSLPSSRVPVYGWTFPGRQTDPAQQPNPYDISLQRRDSVATSPV